MLLKTRIRAYKPEQAQPIAAFLLDNDLAQNVTTENRFITGDFVDSSNHHAETVGYMLKVKRLNDEFEVEAEVVIG